MKKYNKSAFKRVRSCHSGPVEVVKNLFCGGEDEASVMASKPIKVDALVPLLHMNTVRLESRYRGEVLYCPIKDYGILDSDVLEALVSEILDRLNHGKKVGLFCMGGHGRTGYVASVVLGKLGYDDPIGFLRSNYCRKAVESNAQIWHIAEALGKPELIERYGFQSIFDGLDYSFLDFHDLYGLEDGYFSKGSAIDTCGNCVRRKAGKCQKYRTPVDEDDFACDDFITIR